MTSDELRSLEFSSCAADVVSGLHSAADEIDRLTQRVAELEQVDDACFGMNAHQHDRRFHPFTCGNGCRRVPLVATRHGWRCADCNYVQSFGHPCESMMGKVP